MLNISYRVTPVLLIILFLCPLLPGQNDIMNRQERWRFLAPSAPVSDDPRRMPVPPSPHGPPGTLVLVGGRIFDGLGSESRAGTLVIERNKILQILPPGVKNWPDTARVIDVTGKTVMPGLIDLHTHITYPGAHDSDAVAESMSDATLRGVEHLRYYIESGITSVRDVGSNGDAPFRLKVWIQQNRIRGPRIFAAGQMITGTGGHGDEGGLSFNLVSNDPVTGRHYLASGADGWREAVRQQFKRGADLIKIASHFSRAEVTAAVEEAHALGLKVTCDCETFYIQWAVEAGVDMIEHPLPRTDDTIRLMAGQHTEEDPTLVSYMMIFDRSGGYYDTPSRRFTFSKEANVGLVAKMRNAGIKMGIGTDLVSDSYQYLPWAYITELKQFVKAGYSIPNTLEIATRINAELLDMSDKLGTLEPGKLADVIVVDGRPDLRLDDLAKLTLVIRDGYIQVEDRQLHAPVHSPLPMQ
jgi:imidazolonepropionase-like amidohydrolase